MITFQKVNYIKDLDYTYPDVDVVMCVVSETRYIFETSSYEYKKEIYLCELADTVGGYYSVIRPFRGDEENTVFKIKPNHSDDVLDEVKLIYNKKENKFVTCGGSFYDDNLVFGLEEKSTPFENLKLFVSTNCSNVTDIDFYAVRAIEI